MYARSLLVVAALASSSLLGGRAQAEGWNLDGRAAPDFTLAAGMNGVSAGTTLASLRGKVVLLKFWLRDCPICRRTLPEIQDLHAQFSGSGLVVLTILHSFGAEDPVLQQFLQQNGYTFPVGTDRDGSLAAAYGVRSRPVDYLIGIDGRVKSSNGIPREALNRELGLYRLQRLGKVPEGMKPVREAVWQSRIGHALREAATAAGAPGATEETKAVLTRVVALGEDDIRARAAYARYLRARQRGPEVTQALDELTREYAGTSLEAAAQKARTGVMGGA